MEKCPVHDKCMQKVSDDTDTMKVDIAEIKNSLGKINIEKLDSAVTKINEFLLGDLKERGLITEVLNTKEKLTELIEKYNALKKTMISFSIVVGGQIIYFVFQIWWLFQTGKIKILG